MRSRIEISKRTGAAVLCAAMVAATAMPAAASSAKPPEACPPQAPQAAEILAVAAPQVRTFVIADEKRVHAAAAAQLRRVVALEVRMREAAEAETARAVWVLEHELDNAELQRWRQEWLFLDEEPGSTVSHPVAVGIEALVAIAKVPARAVLTVRHLAEAIAKVTPPIARLFV